MKKIFLGGIIFLIFLNFLYSNEINIDYSNIIKEAREGNIQKALNDLKILYEKYPKDKKLFFDYISILGWAKKDKEVIRLTKGMDYKIMPDYTLEIVAKSYRNLKDYKKSILFYKLCLEKNNNNLDCKYGLILVFADDKRVDEALKILSTIKNKNYYYYFLKGYILEAKKAYFDSFINYQKAYELNKKDIDSLKGIVRTLDMLGLPYLAYEYMLKNKNAFDKNYEYRLKKDQIAFKIRWGELVLPDKKERFKEIDEALKALDRLISTSKSKNLKKENPNILQARFDKLVALRDRFYMDKVINEYKKFEKAGIELPYYALNAVGDAYLYKKKPKIAIDFYKKALKKNPKHFESKLGVFYCYVEMFKLNKAIKWIDEIDKSEPAWIRGKYENGYKVESSVASALARYYADFLNKAQKRLEKMSSIAPANVDIKSELANIYKDRGWPRKAIKEIDFALAYEPNHKNANVNVSMR